MKAQAQLVVYQAAYPADQMEDHWEVPTEGRSGDRMEGHLVGLMEGHLADRKVGQMAAHSEDPTGDRWEESWALVQESGLR